jgi:hypothetical protein
VTPSGVPYITGGNTETTDLAFWALDLQTFVKQSTQILDREYQQDGTIRTTLGNHRDW